MAGWERFPGNAQISTSIAEFDITLDVCNRDRDISLGTRVWKCDPLPIAVHELGGHLRTEILAALSNQQREYRVVCTSPDVSGQLAAAESGMAVAVLTRCSLPPSLKILDEKQGLPELPIIDVALMRSQDSKGSRAVDAMYEQVVQSLKDPLYS